MFISAILLGSSLIIHWPVPYEPAHRAAQALLATTRYRTHLAPGRLRLDRGSRRARPPNPSPTGWAGWTCRPACSPSSTGSRPWPKRSAGTASRPSTCSGWAAAACAPRSCAPSTASATGFPRIVVMDTTDEAAITRRAGRASTRRGRSSSSPARAAARSSPPRWRRSSGRTCRRRWATRPDATSSPSPIRAPSWRTSRSARLPEGRSSTRRTSAGASPRCRSSASCPARSSARRCARCSSGGADMAEGCRQENHQNAGLELGAFIGATPPTGRDKLTVVLPPSLQRARPVDRAARRREHRASTARARCRSSTSRSGRRTSTAATARSSRSPPIAMRPTRRAWTRSKRPAIRCCA